MFNKIRAWFKHRQPTTTEEDNLKLLSAMKELLSINEALNVALGNTHKHAEAIRLEAILLLSAIAMQHGGEIIVRSEFMNALKEEGSALRLMSENKDGSVILTLKEDNETCGDK